jgi:hypothetical protein
MNPRSVAPVVVLPALAIMASPSLAQFPGSALRPAGTGGSLLHDAVSKLQVRWGVWRSHRSPGFERSTWDECLSAWQLTALTLYGPVGVKPL